jgi:transcriptional regulator with XRE-family HTH domain
MATTRNQRVSTLLKTQKIDVEELAKASGKHPSSLYRIINGENEPTKSTLKAIAAATGASYNWLLNGTGEMMDPNPKSPAPAISAGPAAIETALNELRQIFQDQLRKKDEQIAGLMSILQKVNFLNPLQDSGAVVIDMNKTTPAGMAA